MPILSRRTFLELAGASMICGCGSTTQIHGNRTSPVLVFSDLHFNPLYDGSLLTQLDAADPSQWQGIYEGSIVTSLSGYGTDTNYLLLKLALSSIRQNLGGCQVIIFSGDLIGHNIAELYTANGGSSVPGESDAFINKTASFVMQQIRSYAGNVPVIFAVGNCDSYSGLGPNSAFLSSTAASYYSELLNSVPDQQEFLNTFFGWRILFSRSIWRPTEGNRTEYDHVFCPDSGHLFNSGRCRIYMAHRTTYFCATCRSESVDRHACSSWGLHSQYHYLHCWQRTADKRHDDVAGQLSNQLPWDSCGVSRSYLRYSSTESS